MNLIKDFKKKDLSLLTSFELLWKLSKFFSRRRKKQLMISFFSVILAGIAEISSLSIALPFITILTDKERILKVSFISNLVKSFNIDPSQLLSIVFVLLIIVVVLSTIIRLFNLWLIHKVVQAIGNDLSTEAFKRTLYQPYEFHLQSDTSKNISSLERSIDGVIVAIESSLLAFTGVFVIACIIITLLKIDYIVTVSIFTVFLLAYLLISKYSKNLLIGNSKYTVANQPQKLKVVQEGIGGIREIILDNTQDYFVKLFSNIDRDIKKRVAQNIFVASSPRYLIESICVILICSLAYIIYSKDYSNFNSIAILGTFALGAQKLLPNMQTAYRCWISINNKKYEIIDILKILNLDIPKAIKSKKNIEFTSKLCLQNISFSHYNSEKKLFNNLNLSIKAGEILGIIGSTGSGKSTLVDVVMGLIKPQKGELLVDDINLYKNKHDLSCWRSSISHVPQNIFLTDRSFIENIAFGIPRNEVDLNLVRAAAKKACIDEFISSTKNGYETFIGERGIRISGGQRQRIGIARALYKKTKLLIFDEATSSLDNDTEDQVMETIYDLDKNLTIIIIAHRLRTVRQCDRILKLKNGTIIENLLPKDI